MTTHQHHDIHHLNNGGKTMASKYVRSNDKMIAGICSLISRETGIDVGLVRVITAVLGVASSGLVVVAYLIAWAVLPAEGQTKTLMDKAVNEGQKFYDQQKAKKTNRPSAQPGPAPTTSRPADANAFDPYQD